MNTREVAERRGVNKTYGPSRGAGGDGRRSEVERGRAAHARRGAGARAGRAAAAAQSARALAMARWLQALVALLALAAATARKSPAPAPGKHEPQIEEVTAKQLDRVLEDKDFVAVYWCK